MNHPRHPRPVSLRRWFAVLSVLGPLLLPGAGCRSIGPETVANDRFHYTTAVADSWKEQLLLNIVKTRYADAPAFLEIVSVVSGYSLERGVNINGQFSPESMRGDTFAAAGLTARFTDRPTISYAPMSGAKFARSLMSPVPLDSLMFVMQGGIPADFILALTVQSLEGLHNETTFGEHHTPADDDFVRALQLIGELQQANLLETEIRKDDEDVEIWLLLHHPDAMDAPAHEQIRELKAILHVPASAGRIKVVFAERSMEPGVIGIRTRSLLQILSTPADPPVAGGFTIHNGAEKPGTSFAAVPYDGVWFWIDQEDFTSKRILTAVTLLFNFLELDAKSTPVLTIPTN